MKNYIHDIIKIKYSTLGYLPDYPPHLISDIEMFDAFLPFKNVGKAHQELDEAELSFFKDFYPCNLNEIKSKYNELINSIAYHINISKTSNNDDLKVPDWIYSYMLGEVVSPSTSTHIQIANLANLMGINNEFDEFDDELYKACYQVSKLWLDRYPKDKLDHRPPTIFAEPHVYKALRLAQADESYAGIIQSALRKEIL